MNFRKPTKRSQDLDIVVAKPAPAPVSKFIDDDNLQQNYGNKILFLSPIEREIAVNIAEGMRYHVVAKLLGMQTKEVKVIANRKHVRDFINTFVKETTVAAKASRIAALSAIIEARLDKEQDMANASELDTATLINMLDTMQREAEKAELQRGNQANVLNVLAQLRKD